ncbi:MAG: flagellar basal body rod protein FlgB [Rhodothermales bacterium]
MIQTERITLLGNALKAYNWRLKAMTSNLANMDTPGYQRMSVKFEETMQEARHTIPGLRDATGIQPRMHVGETGPVLEDELMNMADTQMRTQFSTKALHDHFQMIQSSITGRQ